MRKQRRRNRRSVQQTQDLSPIVEQVPKDDNSQAHLTADKSGDKREKLEVGMLRWTRVVGVFTAVLAALGAIQCWAFIQSERAFIAPAAFRLTTDELKPNVPVVLNLEIKNSGKSTGFVKELNITTWFYEKSRSLPDEPKYLKGRDISPGPIVAGTAYKVRFEIGGLNSAPQLILTDADVGRIKDGRLRLFLVGFISYVDDFTIYGERRLGFCAVYNPDGDSSTRFDSCPNKGYTYVR
jgi:hypothetical protein